MNHDQTTITTMEDLLRIKRVEVKLLMLSAEEDYFGNFQIVVRTSRGPIGDTMGNKRREYKNVTPSSLQRIVKLAKDAMWNGAYDQQGTRRPYRATVDLDLDPASVNIEILRRIFLQ